MPCAASRPNPFQRSWQESRTRYCVDYHIDGVVSIPKLPQLAILPQIVWQRLLCTKLGPRLGSHEKQWPARRLSCHFPSFSFEPQRAQRAQRRRKMGTQKGKNVGAPPFPFLPSLFSVFLCDLCGFLSFLAFSRVVDEKGEGWILGSSPPVELIG